MSTYLWHPICLSSRRTKMPDIDDLIERARNILMTPEQEREQRISFVYGNCAIENPRITREMVEDADRKLVND